MTKTKTLLAAAMTALVFAGAGCVPSSETTTVRPASGPFASISTEVAEGETTTITFATRADVVPGDFYDAAKLPMAAADFYGDNPIKGLGEPTRTYQDEDGDTNRLYAVKGGSLATIELDGDELAIVEYRPDNLMAADFLKPELMEYVPATGEAFLVVLNQGDEDNILFLVDVMDGKVVSVSP